MIQSIALKMSVYPEVGGKLKVKLQITKKGTLSTGGKFRCNVRGVNFLQKV